MLKPKEKVGEAEETKTVEPVDVETAEDKAAESSPYHNKYVGTEKIRGVTEEGDESVITLKNNAVYRVPTLIMQRIITDEKNEHGGGFQDLKLAAISKDILILLTKAYHLRLTELDRVVQSISIVAEHDYSQATSILWEKHKVQVTLEDIEKVLTAGAESMKKIKDSMGKDSVSADIIARRKEEFMRSRQQQ